MEDWKKLIGVINDRFHIGDTVEIPAAKLKGKISQLPDEKYTLVVGDKIIGVVNFYCNVNVDLPITGLMIPNGEKPWATQWLLTGTDGITNREILCELWAKNGELLPRLKPHHVTDTPEGRALQDMLDKMGAEIELPSDKNVAELEAENAYQLIDSGLMKHNQYVEGLAINSRLHLIEKN
jgi:hypothetical protein